MDNEFSFIRKELSTFEIKDESIEQIIMPNLKKDDLPNLEESISGFEDPRWIEKSKSIKKRDNFTCQRCHIFDPRQGDFVYIKQGKYDTLHHYCCTENSIYEIRVEGYSFTINIEFSPGYHLSMPRLNVHHKLYYRNRNLWDYEDDFLVTLCEKCHHYIHSLNENGIPIVEDNPEGQPILIGKTNPKPYYPIFDHTDLGTFIPLALVKENLWGEGLKGQELKEFKKAKKENKDWYDYHEIIDNQVAKYEIIPYNTNYNNHTIEEMKEIAKFIIRDFIENILGFCKAER